MGEIQSVDLFGDVTTLPSGRRGRPRHRWSQSAENKVILGCAMGYTQAQIAKGLGISEPTLRQYYFSALKMRDMHRTRLELWRLEGLVEAGNKGNVGALKEIAKVLEKRDRDLAEQELLGARGAVEEDIEPIGKKAQAARDAEAAASDDPDLNPGQWH